MEEKLKKVKITFCIIFIAIIAVIGCITITNNNEISLKEGRELTTFPKVTINNLTDTNLYTDYTNAFSDQMAFRDSFIKCYYLLSLQRYVGDVVKGKDSQLFLSSQIIENIEKTKNSLKNVVEQDLNKVTKEVTDVGAKFIYLSIPRKDVVMDKYLPSTYYTGTENYLELLNVVKTNIQNAFVIDAYEVFKENDIYDVYYSTDHHMNIRGAYEIFEKLVEYINQDGYNIQVGDLEDEYIVESKVIDGSYNRKIGQSVTNKKEELNLTYKKDDVKYTRYENGKVSNDLVLGTGNTYALAYMNGDNAETVIETNIQDAPNILFVGSSYTNILEALSTYKFHKMVSIDYRDNNTGKSIVDYVKEHDIDYVVFIPAQQTNSFGVSAIKEHLGLK